MTRISTRSVIVAVAAILLMVSLGAGIRWFVRGRTMSASNACCNNLRQFDGAIQQWAVENKASSNAVVTWNDIRPYIRLSPASELPLCPQGGTYTIGRAGDQPRCSIMWHNLDFGRVAVADESGVPLDDARVAVIDRTGQICEAHTSTNGEAYFFDDWRSSLWDNARTNWSDGTKRVVALKPGYQAATNALPTTDWPLKFIVKRASE